MGAVGDNGIGVTGVNWDVQIMALKISDAGAISSAAAIECFNYMTMMKTDFGVNVVVSNNSWGGSFYSQAEKDAIEATNDAGILFVASAGNSGSNNDIFPQYPASYNLDGIVSVAATDHRDNLAGFSCYGATSVDLAAPGVDILSTLPGNTYASWQGTSMAAPQIAGAAGMLMGVNPNATLAEVKAALMTSVDVVPALAGRMVSSGRLNLASAVRSIDPSSSAVERLPFQFDVSGDFVTWDAQSGDDKDIFLYDGTTNSSRRLTNNDTEDSLPQIQMSSDGLSGQVVWVGHDGEFGPNGTDSDSQIFLYSFDSANPENGTTSQLTHSPYGVSNPQVSDTHVIWEGGNGTDRDIFIYDLATGTTQNVSTLVYDHDGLDDYEPQISGSRVVWFGDDGKDNEIYLYDAVTDAVTEVTDNTVEDGWARIDGSNVIWRGFDGADFEIFLYQIDTGTSTQITSNGDDDNRPQISGDSIVWEGLDVDAPANYRDWDIFVHDIPSGVTTNLSSNAATDDSNPQINGNNVVWESLRLGDDWEVMHTEIGTDATPQNVSGDFPNEDRYPQLGDNLVVWRNTDGQINRLMMARQAEAEVTDTISLIVNGDIEVEDNETFDLIITGAEVSGVPTGVTTVVIDDSVAQIAILNDDTGMDFGDAPAGYATRLAEDGARHMVLQGLQLGLSVDPEIDGQPDANALGDDQDALGDDEDGLLSHSQLTPGYLAEFEIQVGGEGYLSAWIDYNQDGIWGEYIDGDGNLVSEQVISSLTSGIRTFDNIRIPDGLDPMTTFLRLRYSSDPNAVKLPTGTGRLPDDPLKDEVAVGEVEDYLVRIEVGDATISGWKFNDLNADGQRGNEPASSGVAPTIVPVSPGDGVQMWGRDSNNVYYSGVLPNNDLSSLQIPFGFDFEFYGTSYDSFYINNNGNITLTSSLSSSPTTGFLPGLPMIAPFWADVDTRGSGGSVHLSQGIAPSGNPFIQVDWAEVGYFDRTSLGNTDARNSFALYMEDDPGGDIVVFNYYDHDGNDLADMGWTTGDNTGSNGFGGAGALIGFSGSDVADQYILARPRTQTELNDLGLQYGFRFDPSTGAPLGPEPGLPGVTMYLDLNGDGALSPDIEPWTVSMRDDPNTVNVDESGYYEFNELLEGHYIVRELVGSDAPGTVWEDWVQTSPSDTKYLAGGGMNILAVDSTQISDRDTFTIGNGTTSLVFEFNNDGSLLNPDAVDVPFAIGQQAATISQTIADALNAAGGSVNLYIVANPVGNFVALTGVSLVFDPGDSPLTTVSSSSNPDGYYEVDLTAGEHLRFVDFGNYERPHLRISDTRITEGDDGYTQVEVDIHMTRSFGAPLEISYWTEDGTALVLDDDYVEANGSYTYIPRGTPVPVITSRTITHNDSNDYDYHVSGKNVAFEVNDGDDWEIFVYDEMLGGDPVQLTDNDVDDRFANLYWSESQNELSLAWAQYDGNDYEIMFTHGDPSNIAELQANIVQLTDNDFDDKSPELSDALVAWWGQVTPQNTDIFIYDVTTIGAGGAPQNISNNPYADFDPRLSGSNVVWFSNLGSGNEVYISVKPDGASRLAPKRLTSNSEDDSNARIEGNNVIWQGKRSGDYELFHYRIDTGTIVQITSNSTDDKYPEISGNNIVWQGGTLPNLEIFQYDLDAGGAANNLSRSPLSDELPQIDGDRVVWHAFDGTDWEVYYYDIGLQFIAENLSDNFDYDWGPQLSDELIVWRSNDGNDFEIVVATQAEPEIVDTITFSIIGDLTPEDDEDFYVNIAASAISIPASRSGYRTRPGNRHHHQRRRPVRRSGHSDRRCHQRGRRRHFRHLRRGIDLPTQCRRLRFALRRFSVGGDAWRIDLHARQLERAPDRSRGCRRQRYRRRSSPSHYRAFRRKCRSGLSRHRHSGHRSRHRRQRHGRCLPDRDRHRHRRLGSGRHGHLQHKVDFRADGRRHHRRRQRQPVGSQSRAALVDLHPGQLERGTNRDR